MVVRYSLYNFDNFFIVIVIVIVKSYIMFQSDMDDPAAWCDSNTAIITYLGYKSSYDIQSG